MNQTYKNFLRSREVEAGEVRGYWAGHVDDRAVTRERADQLRDHWREVARQWRLAHPDKAQLIAHPTDDGTKK